jgi:long-subunit acyl-CoA synthetase (AMP-forming)
MRELFDEDTLTDVVGDIVARVNVDLPRAEQIHAFRLLPYEPSEDSGELDSTLRLRRALVLERFRYLIDEMYIG